MEARAAGYQELSSGGPPEVSTRAEVCRREGLLTEYGAFRLIVLEKVVCPSVTFFAFSCGELREARGHGRPRSLGRVCLLSSPPPSSRAREGNVRAPCGPD